MVNIIIYEDSKKIQDKYKSIIKSFFDLRGKKVCFHIFDCYNDNLELELASIIGKKIFILDVEVPGKSGLDLARNIRSNDDWKSPIIIITSHEQLRNVSFIGKLLTLDFISKREDVYEKLVESLKVAYQIIYKDDFFTFQYCGELHHISYKDILYFEKDINDNYTFLVTKDNSYKIKDNIRNIENYLIINSSFLKIHRSCIINTDNIDRFDSKNNIIYFNKCSIDLLSRNKKNLLIEKLQRNQIVR